MKLYFELDAEGRFKRTLWTIPFVVLFLAVIWFLPLWTYKKIIITVVLLVVLLAQLAINYKKMKEE
ncbi:MAG: hypothetical protein J6L77_09085 [Coprococcus sp.]|nr:hypothetical protein [Coprococcus sp.]